MSIETKFGWHGSAVQPYMETVKRFLGSVRRNVADDGLAGLAKTGRSVRNYVERAWNVRQGTNIYERDWDVLVLLDCARVDMVAQVADEYPFLDPVGTHRTPGTNSAEWMDVTFVDEYAAEMARTAHVTANPNSADHLDGDRFAYFEEIWRGGWDEDTGTVPARTVTNRAIAVGRDRDPDRLLVHYMQPHPPFVPRPEIDAVQVTRPGDERHGMSVRELHEEGGHSLEELWDAHVENLRYVLSEVERQRRPLRRLGRPRTGTRRGGGVGTPRRLGRRGRPAGAVVRDDGRGHRGARTGERAHRRPSRVGRGETGTARIQMTGSTLADHAPFASLGQRCSRRSVPTTLKPTIDSQP
jgi:hypothetical protein